MRRIIFPLLTLVLSQLVIQGQVKLENLRVEHLSDPLGLDILQPRFGWQLVCEKRNVMQSAYQIRVGADVHSLDNGKNLIWSTGKVASDSSVNVAYSGPMLESGKKYFWEVRIWDNLGNPSGWSAPAWWKMGLLHPSDWKASWIQAGFTEDSILRPSPIFRKAFQVKKTVRSAFAYITARGMYEAALNGQRIGNAYLTPGWTSYNKRLPYQTYDVTSLIKTGENVVGATLGNGWYRGYIGFSGQKDFYGKNLSLLLQLEIVYSDGSSDNIVTDPTWKSSSGEIRSSEIYNGELIDAREQKKGWSLAGYDDNGWSGVKMASPSLGTLIATYNEPIRKQEVFKPVRIFVSPKGENLIDFGQNLVGWVLVKVKGKAGDKITISHAEVLDKEGNFYTDNLRAAKAEDTYILKGGEEEVFEPHFTFHGFQFIKVVGYPGELKPENFTAVVLYSDMTKTGTFTSSNKLINQLQHNIQWGQRGNFLDVPTDCPQRDERLGWTGDAQVFSRTATFNMGVNNFFGKWLKDVAADQLETGSLPVVIPNVLGPFGGSTGWADVATIIPWNMWLAYGDRRILEEQYNSMKAWVDYMEKSSKNDLWNTGFHFGDWLFYHPADDNDGRAAVTNKYLIAQCFFAYSTQLLINSAEILGNKKDVQVYTQLLGRVKTAFLREYVTPNGALVSGTQTAYVLALQFDMLPDSLRTQAAARLADNVKSYNNHLTTGFLGTPYLCHVLTRFGYTDLAFKLLMQDTYPSWLYPVKMGATTIWERWDGIKPDSTFETPSMNSYNHYSYGAIGDWMYRVVAGLDTYSDGPGYKHIRIMPHIGGGLTMASAHLQTYYGRVSSGWNTDSEKITFDIEIPANTSATIYLAGEEPNDLTESGNRLNLVKEIQSVEVEKGYVIIKLGSGNYHFIQKIKPSLSK
jgi:alpha-L-rhamnosidase